MVLVYVKEVIMRLNRNELIKLINTLNLEKKDFYILSSAALVLRGIMKDAGDLDIAVTENGFDKLASKFILEAKGDNWYKINDQIEFVVDTLTKEKVEDFGDYYLQDLDCYLDYLNKSDRQKDKERITLILDYKERRSFK